MRIINESEAIIRAAFARKAAEVFENNYRINTFTDKGDIIAIRWNDCTVLVLRASEGV